MGYGRNDTGAVVDSQLRLTTHKKIFRQCNNLIECEDEITNLYHIFIPRVLKTRGLRVADTSVLRVITNANLNAPAILVGEKAAYLVRRHWAAQFAICSKINFYLLFNEDRLCFYKGRI